MNKLKMSILLYSLTPPPHRIRTVDGLTCDRKVVRNDIRLAAKIITNLDTKWGLWPSDKKDDVLGKFGIPYCSVAELPLFWAAPAPGRQGPGADSGSDLLGSAPAPGKKRQLRLHTLKFFILSFKKVSY